MEHSSKDMKVMENENGITFSSSTHKKDGLRTMPFIIVNECLEKVASYGIMPNMILNLKNDYNMSLVNASNLLYTWSAMSNILSIFGAFLSDAYLGRFLVILIGSFSSLLGLTILWLTAMTPELRPSCGTTNELCNSATAAQLAILFLSLGLISIGAGCVRPCSIAFGADQLSIKENSNHERLLDSYFNWYYTSIGASTLIAFGIIVYIQENLGWKIGFAVPVILMLISAFTFIIGSPFYVKVKASNSLLTSFVQVVVVAMKNRKIDLSECSPDQYYRGHNSEVLVSTNNLRFLNKACVIRNPVRDLKSDGSVSNPWSLCTIEKVESLKAFLSVLPMWSTSIFMGSQGSFSLLQANTMDRRLFGNFKIPAGSFSFIMIVTLSIVIPLYDRIIVPRVAKYTGRPRGISSRLRMGIGLLFTIASRVISSTVETMRRSAAIEQGQIEFFYSYFPKSMSSFAMAMLTLGLATADIIGSVIVNTVDKVTCIGSNESWLSTNINKGHLNYYYALLTLLASINFLYFLAICSAYGSDRAEKVDASASNEDDKFDYMELPSSKD
ncbi:hypothetical protein TanjilG_20852 [Lupinus angustifolius]|uniref:Uncharacterized protein n=1 Tax=Lupinus angustifolius TaxID=3871 RepID=A0A1J7HNL5_LUPAN|nr:hypothetical protein TanjilG_20852 [Lupinus angustifolius]